MNIYSTRRLLVCIVHSLHALQLLCTLVLAACIHTAPPSFTDTASTLVLACYIHTAPSPFYRYRQCIGSCLLYSHRTAPFHRYRQYIGSYMLYSHRDRRPFTDTASTLVLACYIHTATVALSQIPPVHWFLHVIFTPHRPLSQIPPVHWFLHVIFTPRPSPFYRYCQYIGSCMV